MYFIASQRDKFSLDMCWSIDPEDNICKHIKLYLYLKLIKDLYIWWNLVEKNVKAGSRENKKTDLIGKI